MKFLIEPFLESPESLKTHCERISSSQRVWIRVAFEGADKGRVFGRGGRNIQAIRAVLKAAAEAAGDSVYLDIHGSHSSQSSRDGSRNGKSERSRRDRSSVAKG
ncbi:MAG: KH domain-containing protein [Cyanophyceae cyanobacterium]